MYRELVCIETSNTKLHGAQHTPMGVCPVLSFLDYGVLLDEEVFQLPRWRSSSVGLALGNGKGSGLHHHKYNVLDYNFVPEYKPIDAPVLSK